MVHVVRNPKLLLRFSLSFLALFAFNSLDVSSSEPKIVYMDGHSRWDSCLPGLKRSVNGESGLLISHTSYGTQPYNGSKNCFLSITVPLGYRIRIKALDFDVFGDGRRCEKDTLHIFDHEQPIDPRQLDHLPVDQRTPGQILGQFCGKFPSGKNSSRMAESTHNTLTLWWHTDANLSRESHEAEGFRLLWSSFRQMASKKDDCKKDAEFRCTVDECIPLALGCNAFADCADGSDLDTRLQVEHKCEHIPGDVFSQLTGIKKLLICLAIALFFVCSCFFCCACFYLCRPGKRNQKHSRDSLLEIGSSARQNFEAKNGTMDSNLVQIHLSTSNNPPLPPSFSPPQVPSDHQVVSPPKVVQQQTQGSRHVAHQTSPPFAVAESSSAIVSTSSSASHPHQSTVSSLNTSTTTGVKNLPVLPRTTHLPTGGDLALGQSKIPNRTMNIGQPPQLPQRSSNSGAQQQQKVANNPNIGEYTYVQNEQRHLLL